MRYSLVVVFHQRLLAQVLVVITQLKSELSDLRRLTGQSDRSGDSKPAPPAADAVPAANPNSFEMAAAFLAGVTLIDTPFVADSDKKHVVFQPLSPVIAANLLRLLANLAEHPNARAAHGGLIGSAETRQLLQEMADLPVTHDPSRTSGDGVSPLVSSGAHVALAKIAWRP